MRFGVYLPNFGAFGSARAVASIAREAEQAGWDGLFVWDHVARPFATDVVDPWIALTAAALATERIRLGALVTPLARRRPWKLAREVASLDQLSNGRLVFGAGLGSAGGAQVEWEGLGEETDLRRRAELLDEGLDILVGLTSGRPFSHQGRHFTVSETVFRPPARQTPHVPVWIAGYWPGHAPFRRAARWEGVFPLFRPEVADRTAALRDVIEFVRKERAASSDFDVAYLAEGLASASTDRRCAHARESDAAGATWWLDRITPDEFGAGWEGDWPIAEMRARVQGGRRERDSLRAPRSV